MGSFKPISRLICFDAEPWTSIENRLDNPRHSFGWFRRRGVYKRWEACSQDSVPTDGMAGIVTEDRGVGHSFVVTHSERPPVPWWGLSGHRSRAGQHVETGIQKGKRGLCHVWIGC